MSNEDLLKILEAHGQQFLHSFDTPVPHGKRKDSPGRDSERITKKKRVEAEYKEESEEEEWATSEEEEEGEEKDNGSDDDLEADGSSDEGEEASEQFLLTRYIIV